MCADAHTGVNIRCRCNKAIVNGKCKVTVTANDISKQDTSSKTKHSGFEARNGLPKSKLDGKGLKVCHLNVQSLPSCIDELKLWLKDNHFHIITLSETWIDDTISDDEINISGFSIERRDRNRHGGGIAVYVNEGIKYTRRLDVEKNNMESLWIEIKQVYMYFAIDRD